MILPKRKQWPITMTYFFLSCVGFGLPQSPNERRLLNISMTMFYVIGAGSMYILITGLYLKIKTVGNTPETIFALFGLLVASVTESKLIAFTLQRNYYENLLRITRDKLWMNSWTDYGEIVLNQCENEAKHYLFVFVILGHLSGAGFILEPLINNMKHNETNGEDRYLPVEPIINCPMNISPYYELMFLFEGVAIYFVTILYFCFDYYLVITNIFVAGQFDILARRFEDLYSKKYQIYDCNGNNIEKLHHILTMDCILREFKSCIEQHQFLICLVAKVEDIYKIINLFQILTYRFIICLVGYELLTSANFLLFAKYAIFGASCIIQLLAFSLSCHNVMITSGEVAEGFYYSHWYLENSQKEGRILTKDFIMVYMRTREPCQLTGWGFFPITLDTLKSILTTAFSYLTLMKQIVN